MLFLFCLVAAEGRKASGYCFDDSYTRAVDLKAATLKCYDNYFNINIIMHKKHLSKPQGITAV